MGDQAPKYLEVLESAISDVGVWRWWTSSLPEAFQIEFGGTQLWMPPVAAGAPPSGQVALRFYKPRLVCFVTLDPDAPQSWPDRMHKDELEPFTVDYGCFTLSSPALAAELLAGVVSAEALVGVLSASTLPTAGEAFIAFAAPPVGLIVAAESMGVLGHQGEMDAAAVVESNRRWGEYWREYWARRNSSDPMPKDYACEVTIPADG